MRFTHQNRSTPLAADDDGYELVLLDQTVPHLPQWSLESAGPLPQIDSSPAQKVNNARTVQRSGRVWLDGDAILCACPDCRAPMSVRLWLMVADCWRCGASIELTAGQEREIERLLAERQRQPAQPPPVRPA